MDAGSPLPSTPDAGSPSRDAGSPTPDAGSPPRDAGSPPRDAGSPPRDAGSPTPDAGSPPRDAGSPTPDAGSPPRDAGGSGSAPYDLGHSPDPAMQVAWPIAPRTTREVRVSNLSAANTAASQSGTRLIVSGALGGTLQITASDIEVIFEPGASAGAVWIANRLSRVRVQGGRVGYVEMQLPATFWPSEEWHEDWMTTDVMIDGIQADASDTAFLMRSGVRIAIINSRGHAVRYNVWFGDTGHFESEDIILAGNTFISDGPEATVRLVHVVRSATVDNRLQNGAKHNYRVHGRSDLNWASNNLLINTGVMIGTMDGDVIGRNWFDDNVFHHTAPSLIQVHPTAVSRFYARRNEIHTNVWDCFLCVTPSPGWVVTDNSVGPYTPPPAE